MIAQSNLLIEIGPNLFSFLVQLLVVIGTLAAAYRGQSIAKHFVGPPQPPG